MALPALPPDSALYLRTDRLLLEPVTEADTDELHALFLDPALHLYAPYEPLSPEAQRERCVRWARRRSPEGGEIWLNWVARGVGERSVLGHFQAGVREDRSASIGYLIAREHQRKGYATEGLRAVMALLRMQFEVREIRAWIDTRNLSSIALAEKVGMTAVERIANADFFKGSASDEWVYVLRVDQDA